MDWGCRAGGKGGRKRERARERERDLGHFSNKIERIEAVL